MEDDEILIENDPLAIYLKNVEMNDFEIVHLPDTNILTNNEKSDNVETSIIRDEDMQLYVEQILKLELLLEEDYNILQPYCLNKLVLEKKTYFFEFSTFSTLLSITILKFFNFQVQKIVYPIISLTVVYKLVQRIRRYIRQRKVYCMLNTLRKLTTILKKSLKFITEFSATLHFYSSATINSSTINTVYTRYVKQFYSHLLDVNNILGSNASHITNLIPLKVENPLGFSIKQDLFIKDEVDIAKLKLLFQLYLLIQSDFLKTVGLSFCPYLWICYSKSSVNKLINSIIPEVTEKLNTKIKLLENDYNVIKNYGKQNTKSVRKSQNINTPTHFISSCLYNTELHFQQLLCKSQDLQSLLQEGKLENKDDNRDLTVITNMLREMETQLNSSKTILEAVFKYFNQLQSKNDTEDKITIPKTVNNLQTVETEQENLLKEEKLTYELYIPKEGLDLTELEVDSTRPVFSMKDLDYSIVLLQELRTILKSRNPDVFEENTRKPEIHSDSEDEETFYNSYRKRNIVRPIQPEGLAENLKAINHVLATRKNIVCDEICDGASSDSDVDNSLEK